MQVFVKKSACLLYALHSLKKQNAHLTFLVVENGETHIKLILKLFSSEKTARQSWARLVWVSLHFFLSLIQQWHFCSFQTCLVSKMSAGYFHWQKSRCYVCLFMKNVCIAVFPSRAENKQMKTSSGRWLLCTWSGATFCLWSLCLFFPQNDATSSPLTVSGAFLMSPLRAPGAVLPLHSQIKPPALVLTITFLGNASCPSVTQPTSSWVLGRWFSLVSVITKHRLITFSQDGWWFSCPAAPLGW